MNNKIFLIGGNRELSPMVEQRYDSESILQELLADYPDLLAGEQIDPDNPRRWLLVAREMGVADDLDAAARWSLDHLFSTRMGCRRLSR